MTDSQTFQIAYIGGGSRFVVNLAHGIARDAEAIRRADRPIEIMLYDVDPNRAEPMAKYIGIVAREYDLPLTATPTGDRDQALSGAAWVIFSAGIWEPIMALRKQFEDRLGGWEAETGPWTAIEAAALWPHVCELAEAMKQYAPDALFTILVNPTEVLASAVEHAFGIRSVGLCVEVPQLFGFLAYYLKVEPDQMRIKHIGANHSGWVTEWSIPGVSDTSDLIARLDAAAERDDWYPLCDEFVMLLKQTGYMRSSPYHLWPFSRVWTDNTQQRMDVWTQRTFAEHGSRRDHRRACFEQALAGDRMIQLYEPTKTFPEAADNSFPVAEPSLGAMAAGLMGQPTGPFSLQMPNAGVTDAAPGDCWLEAPARFVDGSIAADPVVTPDHPVFEHTMLVLQQRQLIADWLATGDREQLRRAMLILPECASLPALVDVANELPHPKDATS